MRITTWIGAAVAVLLCSVSAHAQIKLHSGLAGSWWNSARSGEGFNIEISRLQGSMMVSIYWYTYVDGAPIFLVGASPHDPTATSVDVDLFLSTGGQFGAAFDPGQVTATQWGTARLSFDSCQIGRVEYSSPTEGEGSILIERFGTPTTYACSAVTPGGDVSFPFVAQNWVVSKGQDAITDRQFCILRDCVDDPNSVYSGCFGFYKRSKTDPIVIEGFVALGASTFYQGNASGTLFRVDSNTPVSLSETNFRRSNTTGEPSTTSRSPDQFGGLLPQLLSGRNLVARIVPLNSAVRSLDVNYPLVAFPEALQAFDVCVDQINSAP